MTEVLISTFSFPSLLLPHVFARVLGHLVFYLKVIHRTMGFKEEPATAFRFPELSTYKWSCNEENKRFPVENPATGKVITIIQAGDASSVEQAIQASQVAFEQRWRWVSPKDRSTYLFRCAEELEKHADELATLLCLENGKPQQDARMFDINFLLGVFRFFASLCDKLPSEFYDRGSMYATVLYEPYGVCCGTVNSHIIRPCARFGPNFSC